MSHMDHKVELIVIVDRVLQWERRPCTTDHNDESNRLLAWQRLWAR